MNIRVYKTISPEGHVDYVWQNDENGGFSSAEMLETVAPLVKAKIDKYFEPSNLHPFLKASIDFRPFHDMEWRKESVPTRCEPLNAEEKELFYKHFM